jgi:hypothetical protein
MNRKPFARTCSALYLQQGFVPVAGVFFQQIKLQSLQPAGSLRSLMVEQVDFVQEYLQGYGNEIHREQDFRDHSKYQYHTGEF